jgi:hypothetical protein
MEVTLIKRVYLGDGYYHHFIKEKTQEEVYVPCSQAEYLELGQTNKQPTLDGYKWVGSAGGTIKVDTPTGVLGEDEFCEINDHQVFVRLSGKEVADSAKVLPKDQITNDSVSAWQ